MNWSVFNQTVNRYSQAHSQHVVSTQREHKQGDVFVSYIFVVVSVEMTSKRIMFKCVVSSPHFSLEERGFCRHERKEKFFFAVFVYDCLYFSSFGGES